MDFLKAANSLALKDLFDGVDEPLIVITATIYVEIAASAAIIKISATGGITFEVTIDLFDPFPDTSEGLIRPFELLSLGSSPLDWFEFTLSITLSVSISVEIGIYLGFIEITLFEIRTEFRLEIVPGLVFKPNPVVSLVVLDELTGVLSLSSDRVEEGGELNCFSRSGDVGDEEIECTSGNLYRTFSGIKSLCGNPISCDDDAPSSSSLVPANNKMKATTVTFDCIQSRTDFRGFGPISLMNLRYQECPDVVSNNKVFISQNQVVAGISKTFFDHDVIEGCLITPKPEIDLFTTFFGSECDSKWVIDGHSNVEVKASELLDGCAIEAPGAATDAKLRIDFGSGSDCTGRENKVVLTTDDDNNVIATISPKHLSGDIRVTVGSIFKNIEILGSPCNDEIILERTPFEVEGSVSIDGQSGNNTITIGTTDNGAGVDSIFKRVYVYGGLGKNTLIVDDSASDASKTEGVLDGGSLLNILNGSELYYGDFDNIIIKLSGGANVFAVASTFGGSLTEVYAGGSGDKIYVNETQGDIIVDGGAGNDEFYFTGLGDNATANVYGNEGNDKLFVDGTAGLLDVAVNTFDTSTLRWSGGPGNDTLNTVFTSNGTSNLDIFDDLLGTNTLNINCSDFSCFVLSRENFLANIHDMNDTSSSVERINIDRKANQSEISGFTATATIQALVLSLRGGNNSMFFDDTFAVMDVFGGPNRDGEFRVKLVVLPC